MSENDHCTIDEVAADHVTIENAFAKSVECDSLEMERAGAGMIVAGGEVSMHRSGAGALVADGEMRLVQSGAAVMVANEAEVTQGFVGVLAATDVEFGPDTRVLATWREAVIFGVVFGVVAALVDLAFRGFCGRR